MADVRLGDVIDVGSSAPSIQLGDVIDTSSSFAERRKKTWDEVATDFIKKTPLKKVAELSEQTDLSMPEGQSVGDWALGAAETVPAVASGILSSIVAPATAVVKKAVGGDQRPLEDIATEAGETTTYRPRTKTGEHLTKAVNLGFGGVVEAVREPAKTIAEPLTSTARDLSKAVGVSPEYVDYITKTALEFYMMGKPMHMINKAIAQTAKLPLEAVEKVTQANEAKFKQERINKAQEKIQSTDPTIKAQGEAELASATAADKLTPAPKAPPAETWKASQKHMNKGADELARVAAEGEKELETGEVVEPVVEKPLGSNIEQSIVQPTTPQVMEPPPLGPGVRVRHRGREFTVQDINEDGSIQVFGREKPLSAKYTRVVPDALPIDISVFENDYKALLSAGYRESQLANMTHADMQGLLNTRLDNLKQTPTADVLQKQQAVHDGILAYQRKKYVENVQLLKEAGVSDSEIAGMSEYAIRQRADEMRAGKPIPQVQRLRATLDEFDKMKEEIGKPIDQMTPEELDRLNATLGEVKYETDIVDTILPDVDELARLQEEGITDDYLDKVDAAADNRALSDAVKGGDKRAVQTALDNLVEEKGRLVSEEEFREYLKKFTKESRKKERPGQKVVKRTEGGELKVTKLPEFTKEMATEAEPIEPTHRPGKQAKGERYTEGEWEDILADEGMPSELDFEMLTKAQELSFQDFIKNEDNLFTKIDHMMATKAGRRQVDNMLARAMKELEGVKGSEKEMEYLAKLREFSNRRRAFDLTGQEAQYSGYWSVLEARRALPKAYGYMPSSFTKGLSKEGFLANIRDIENKAKIVDASHRTGSSPLDEVDRLLRDKELDKETADMMKAVIEGYQGKANFDLVYGRLGEVFDLEERRRWEADPRNKGREYKESTSSYYDFARNIMRVKSTQDFVHETGHPAFHQLTPAERIQYTKSLLDQFYKEDGSMDYMKLAKHLNTTNMHEMIAPAEIFCRELQNYIGQQGGWRGEHSNLFQKAVAFMKRIVTKALGADSIPADRRAILGKVFSDISQESVGRAPVQTLGPRRRIVRPVQAIEPSTFGRVEFGEPGVAEQFGVFQGSAPVERFMKYLNKFIGSGEGAQVRGWGHYFTSSLDVAKWYARTVYARKVRKAPLHVNGVPMYDTLLVKYLGPYELDPLYKAAKEQGSLRDMSFAAAKGSLLGSIKERMTRGHGRPLVEKDPVRRIIGNSSPEYLDIMGRIYDEVDHMTADSFKKATDSMKKIVYDVNIPDDALLLDLDRPVFPAIADRVVDALEHAKQSKWGKFKDNAPIIDDIINSLKEEDGAFGKPIAEDILSPFDNTVLFPKGTILDGEVVDRLQQYGATKVWIEDMTSPDGKRNANLPYTGERLQRSLQYLLGDKGASRFLFKKAGVDGNTYIGDTSGVRNYVMFDESVPEIQNYVTLDSLGFQQIYERLADLYVKLKNKDANPINSITKELGGTSADADRINRGMPSKVDKDGNVVPDKIKDKDKTYSYWNEPGKLMRSPLGAPALPGIPRAKLKGWADGTPVEPTVYGANLAEQASSFHHANNIVGLREIQIHLQKNNIDPKVLTSFMRGKEVDFSKIPGLDKADSGRRAEYMQALNEGAGKVRNWLDYMRDRYRDFLKGEYARHLSKKEAGALFDLINGKSEVATMKKWRFSPESKDAVQEIYKKYQELENWGIDDYLPKVELGSYRVLDDKGRVLAVALSQKDAVRKILGKLNDPASDWYTYNGDFYIDNTPRSQMFDHLTGLGSRKAYYAVVNKLAKAIVEEVEGISKAKATERARQIVHKQFSVKPIDKYSEFTEKRHEMLEGEEDIFPVLAKYSRVMEKKMAIDPVIHEYKKNVRDNIPQNLRLATDRLIEDVKGRYWGVDKVVDGWLNEKVYKPLEERGVDVGPPPMMTVSRMLGRGRELEANLKLGYRPANAVINLLSGHGHVWAKVGEGYIKDAVKELYFGGADQGVRVGKSQFARELLDELGPYMGMTFIDEGLAGFGDSAKAGTFSTRRAGEGKLLTYGKPLGLFQAAELPNREIGLIANYLMAKDKFKMSDAAAKETAIRANWFQNFTYNLANLPAFARNPLGKTMMQFKPYMMKEIEFLGSLRPAELLRYITMQGALGGPRAGLYLLKSLPFIGAFSQWDEIERWLNSKYPRASRGIPGALGVDVSAMAAFQMPQDVEDWAGPLLSDLMRTYEYTMKHVQQGDMPKGQIASPSNLNALTMANAPMWRHWNAIWKNVLTGSGELRDPKTDMPLTDNPLWLSTDDYYTKVKNATAYAFTHAMGATPIEESVASLESRLEKREEKRLGDLHKNVQPEIARRLRRGEEVPAWLWRTKEELMQEGYDVTGRGLETVLEDQLIPPTERRLRRKSQQRQQDILEHAPQFD